MTLRSNFKQQDRARCYKRCLLCVVIALLQHALATYLFIITRVKDEGFHIKHNFATYVKKKKIEGS